MRTIDIAEARAPVVLAIDVGSSSVRALLYDSRGDQIIDSEEQLSYTQQITSDGSSESDPVALFDLIVRCVDGALIKAGGHATPIAAVGLTSFWHGLMGLDETATPCTPIYMWSDKRSGTDAVELGRKLDPSEVHSRTGCRIHSSYWPAKLRWLKRTQPEQFARVRMWVSFTDYVMKELSGSLATSISMASGTGLLNRESLEWDDLMLVATGLPLGNLPPIVDRSDPYPPLHIEYASRWPALATIPWYPAIGDGAAANVGAGCVGPARMALTIGTSAAMRIIVAEPNNNAGGTELPERIWSYRLDRRRQVIGGALSNGGNVTGWMADHLAGGDFDELTEAAENIGPDAHGLTMLPFLAGERSPSWNDSATGAVSGLRLSTTGGDLFRATLEATAYRLAAIYDDLKPLAAQDHEIHANGAAALGSPLWLQIIADTLGHRIDAVEAEAEASARGAALCALEASGYLGDLDDIPMTVSTSYESDQANHQRYRTARKRQATLEEAINNMTQKQGE
jgi:gluconokinase